MSKNNRYFYFIVYIKDHKIFTNSKYIYIEKCFCKLWLFLSIEQINIKDWDEKYKDLFFLFFKFYYKDLYNVHLKSNTYCFIFNILIIKMLLIAKK